MLQYFRLMRTVTLSATTLTLVTIGVCSAGERDALYANADRERARLCMPTPGPECWRPAANLLRMLPAPENARELEIQLMSNWMLGKAAYAVGDFDDAGRFYASVRKLNTEPSSGQGMEQEQRAAMSVLIGLAETELALSMGRFASALHQLDDIAATFRNLGAADFPDSTVLLRAAALIGLHRRDEANALMEAALSRLSFDAKAAWEYFPGPQPLNPADLARRLAASHVYAGNTDRALALLKMLEGHRSKLSAAAPKELAFIHTWAEKIREEELLADLAAVHISQGRYDLAEPALLMSLKVAEVTDKAGSKALWMQLAKLYQRTARNADAENAAAQASAIRPIAARVPTDPLAGALDHLNHMQFPAH